MASFLAFLPEYLFSVLTSLSPTTFFLAVVTAATVAYYYYINTCHDHWTRYGVKSPKLPKFFFSGNNFRAQFTELIQKYGDTVGVINRSRMELITTNLDLLRHILIKDFNNFVDRNDNFPSKSAFGKSLFFARGSDWRRQRQIVSPTFSTGKLRYISKSVEKSAQDLTELLETFAKKRELVPIKKLCGQYTCEIIAKTAFGLDAHFIGQNDVEFYEYANSMLRSNNPTGLGRLFFFFAFRIPYFVKFAVNVLHTQFFDPIDHKSDRYFGVVLKNTISERRQKQSNSPRSREDFLDLLLKANEAAAAGKLEKSEDEDKTTDWDDDGKSVKSMSDEEMIGQSMLVIFAGMETTATTLQMCLTELADNPDVQEKVYEEITRVVKSESPTPEELTGLTYTEQVINETLRLHNPVPLVTRIARETRTYNGVTIPKGTLIQIPYFYILRDPKNYPDPEKFDPNRFSPEEKEKRDPLAFVAFGHGPRLCLGMRLAYLELKQGLVHILRKLRVTLNENTEPKKGGEKVKFIVRGVLTPEKTIMLAFEAREPRNE